MEAVRRYDLTLLKQQSAETQIVQKLSVIQKQIELEQKNLKGKVVSFSSVKAELEKILTSSSGGSVKPALENGVQALSVGAKEIKANQQKISQLEDQKRVAVEELSSVRARAEKITEARTEHIQTKQRTKEEIEGEERVELTVTKNSIDGAQEKSFAVRERKLEREEQERDVDNSKVELQAAVGVQPQSNGAPVLKDNSANGITVQSAPTSNQISSANVYQTSEGVGLQVACVVDGKAVEVKVVQAATGEVQVHVQLPQNSQGNKQSQEQLQQQIIDQLVAKGIKTKKVIIEFGGKV